MTTKSIARVIDIASDKKSVTIISGDKTCTIDWPQVLPNLGDVFEVEFTPTFRILKQTAQALTFTMDGDAMRWRKPDAQGRTRMQNLWDRHLIKRTVREYLHEQKFIEIDTPLLVRGTTPDAEIESFSLEDRYLITSSEYQIKRIEIGGFDHAYTFTQNFRMGDRGTYRNPEFTMIEWVRVGGTLADIETDAENFTRAAHKALGGDGKTLVYLGNTVDISGAWDRITVKDAIKKHLNVKVDSFTTQSMIDVLQACKIDIRDEWKDDATFLFTIVLDHLQELLGFGKPAWLTDWPKFLTSSAEEHASGNFTYRSELFICGVEISDGFPSLTNHTRQVKNFNDQQERRRETGRQTVRLDDIYIEAMREGFPSGAGMALGFDRLVMLLTNQESIYNVIAFNWDEC